VKVLVCLAGYSFRTDAISIARSLGASCMALASASTPALNMFPVTMLFISAFPKISIFSLGIFEKLFLITFRITYLIGVRLVSFAKPLEFSHS